MNVSEKTSDKELEKDINTENEENEEAVIKPRKRKIMRNTQLVVTAAIVLAMLLFVVIWQLFFNQSLVGKWHYTAAGEYEETFDNPDTSDKAEPVITNKESYSETMVYEFDENGVCRVSLGTMTIEGTYELMVTENEGNIISANVYMDSSPVFFGTYAYKVKGNVFSGKKLELTNVYYEDSTQVLEQGGEEPELLPIENTVTDPKLTGTWYDNANDITYEFTEDGYMIRTTGDGMTVKHTYGILQDNVILTKYIARGEQSYTYSYEFVDDKLYIDGFEVKKVNK